MYTGKGSSSSRRRSSISHYSGISFIDNRSESIKEKEMQNKISESSRVARAQDVQSVVKRGSLGAATVTGITHLVHAVKGSIYNGHIGEELEEGTVIEIDSSNKIRSRRGPNQEDYSHYDAQNAPEYRWIRVIKVNDRVQLLGTYIRDDTFTGGSSIPRGSVPFVPAIDHRERTRTDLPTPIFTPPKWYERRLDHVKRSNANRKHDNLLATAFGSSLAGIGPAMVKSAEDPDTGVVLAAISQHMTHVTTYLPIDAGRHGKDRHENYDREGEYSRTSPGHPLHKEFEVYQDVLGIYRENKTTEPVNAGWAAVASAVMGVTNMHDDKIDFRGEFSFREAEHPERIARGPGAVIGHEEMAREAAQMRRAILKNFSEHREKFIRLGEILEKISSERGTLEEEKIRVEEHKKKCSNERENILENIKKPGTTREEKQEKMMRINALKDVEKTEQKRISVINLRLQELNSSRNALGESLERMKAKYNFYIKYIENDLSKTGAPFKEKYIDMRPLENLRLPMHRNRPNSFAGRLLRNRGDVKLDVLFGMPSIRGISDVGGREHPNLVLEKAEWDGKENEGVKELHQKWESSGLCTSLQIRGSFGHHRPSISPLANGKVRINPGLYPVTLLKIGLKVALDIPYEDSTLINTIDSSKDMLHREALQVAVDHALTVIAADRPGKSLKIERIKIFAKKTLMTNLVKAQIILKAPIPTANMAYVDWLQNDYYKTILALENLNESTHLLLSARVNEEAMLGENLEEDPLLNEGPFREFVRSIFAGSGNEVDIYYVASGMQAITTGAMAAVHYRRKTNNEETGKAAGYVALHPYFEMKDQTARAAGFDARLGDKETIVADLSPLNTFASKEEQSREAVRDGLQTAFSRDITLVPVLDATTIALDEVSAMIPREAANFIIVESLTKYAQLGSDKALGGRIIVVGTKGFLAAAKNIIKPVERNANMMVSKIWFESMENMRYSH